MKNKLNRKEFLKVGGGATAAVFISSLVKPAWGQSTFFDFSPKDENNLPELLILDANPPLNTSAVRYYINNMQVSELTDLYAQQTNTKPIWKTLADTTWFEPGESSFRIEADTKQGTVVLKDTKIIIPKRESSKQSISLNGAWRYSEAGGLPGGAAEGNSPSAVSLGFNDTKWATIVVPHSLGYVDKKWNQYEGILGVYRRTIKLIAQAKNEQISIVLQSCYWSGRVFINGIEVGQTKGGYLPSRFDITKEARNGENLIAVITDNRFETMGVFQRLHYYYWNWGGLLQEVSIERNPDATIIDMRATGNKSGNLKLWFTSVNKTSADKQKNISVDVYNPSGKKILNRKISITLPVGETFADPVEFKINNPILWNLEEPNLYRVVVKGEGISLKERTGFRTVKALGGDLMINDKIIEKLQGFDRHADYPGLGKTQPTKLPHQELKELYDKGFRIFRPAHYPTTPAELDAADELGMLVIEEINVTGLKGAQLVLKEVKDFAAHQLTGMIHRDRSHPCIIAWSVGNENLTSEDGAIEYVRDTIHLGRTLDNTRLFTQVSNQGTKDKTFEFLDIILLNYYAGWYTKEMDAVVRFLDKVQPYAGNKPMLISEYGAEAVIDRQGTGKGTEFYQGFVVDQHNKLLNNREHFVGKLYWSSTEFWCRPDWAGGNPAPVPPFHVKGLQGYYRERNKLAWRVMFSPVRLSFGKSNIIETAFGGELKVPADKSTLINQPVILQEVKGRMIKGTLIVVPPIGFKEKVAKYPFQLNPNESKTIDIALEGKLPTMLPAADGYVKAVIDGDTEAQPLLLTVSSQ